MNSHENRVKLQSSRQKGLSRLLLLARRNFVSIVHAELKKTGILDLPDSCITILPYIDLEGTSASTIAQRASISKQAIVPLIAIMESRGIVCKHKNPADGRSSLISFTSDGVEYLHNVHLHIDAVERRVAAALGHKDLEALREVLVKIIKL